MIPTMQELLPYIDNRKAAAEKFNVTEKTIVNWLKSYNLYKPKENFGCGKLCFEKALEIRRLYQLGKTVKELTQQFGVNATTISRVIHNVIYKEAREIAQVTAVYNVNTSVAVGSDISSA